MANKKRFTFIDAIIILAVIVVIAVGWMYFSNNASESGEDISYDIAIIKTFEDVAHEIQPGDKIYDSIKNFEIGVVDEVSVSEATESVYDYTSGEYKTVTVPERVDIIISVTGKGSIVNGKTFVNGYELFTGKQMFIKGPNFASEAIAYEIGGVK